MLLFEGILANMPSAGTSCVAATLRAKNRRSRLDRGAPILPLDDHPRKDGGHHEEHQPARPYHRRRVYAHPRPLSYPATNVHAACRATISHWLRARGLQADERWRQLRLMGRARDGYRQRGSIRLGNDRLWAGERTRRLGRRRSITSVGRILRHRD